jgi:hypothetical protein
MNEITAPPEKSLRWYLRSLADQDTHCRWMSTDDSVLALRSASFTPRPTLRVIGPPPGQLVDGPRTLPMAPIPVQVRPACQRGGAR